MLALITVLTVVLVSLLITRVATIVLALTGMSKQSARFQARSALSGAGFTTTESESVVNHPIRRQVVLRLMLIGSAGVVTAIASLVVSFGGETSSIERLRRGGVLIAGLFGLWLIARSDWFDRQLSRVILRVMRSRGLDVRDYVTLLHLGGGCAVNEMTVQPDHWVVGRSLEELRLRDEGILVLGVERPGGVHIGVPPRNTRLEAGDRLTVYGPSSRVDELDERRAGPEGDRAHAAAVAERQREAAAQDAERDLGAQDAGRNRGAVADQLEREAEPPATDTDGDQERAVERAARDPAGR